MNTLSSSELDRRVARTRRAIHDAILDILAKKPLTEITVTELCNKADINRKTFYMYYSTPADVFNEYVEIFATRLKDFLDEFSKEMNVFTIELIFSLVTPLVESDEHIRNLVTSPNTGLFYERLVKLFTDVFIIELNRDSAFDSHNQITKNVIASSFAGSLVTVYFQYSQDPKVNLVEVTNVLSSILTNGLSSFAE